LRRLFFNRRRAGAIRRSTRTMPLNPKIEQVLDMIARAKRPQYHHMTAQQARASYEKSSQFSPKAAHRP
jgi:hypothetical protein